MSNIEWTIFTIGFWGMMLAALLYVIFGQVTVRKLKKNPETQEQLGVDFVSGLNIMGVAQMLSIPRSWARKLDQRSSLALLANSDALYRCTTTTDRVLARIFYYLSATSTITILSLAAVDFFSRQLQ